jgi:hypothetical protein
MIKKVVSLIVVALVANAVLRLGIVVLHDQQFKDAVRELALFAAQPPAKTDEVLRKKVMQLAQDNQIPLYPDYVEISRYQGDLGEKVTIKFAYATMVQLAPGYSRRFDFNYTTP